MVIVPYVKRICMVALYKWVAFNDDISIIQIAQSFFAISTKQKNTKEFLLYDVFYERKTGLKPATLSLEG